MIEITRDIIDHDEVFGLLHKALVKNHIVANHTRKVLLKNRHIKDFCEEARHFTIMQGEPPMYLHYDCASWFKEPNGVRVIIETIGIYDDFMEYEKARMFQLHKAEHKDIPNIN